jgi:hypothetical protein
MRLIIKVQHFESDGQIVGSLQQVQPVGMNELSCGARPRCELHRLSPADDPLSPGRIGLPFQAQVGSQSRRLSRRFRIQGGMGPRPVPAHGSRVAWMLQHPTRNAAVRSRHARRSDPNCETSLLRQVCAA